MGIDISAAGLWRYLSASPIPMTLASATEPDRPLILANDAFLKLTGHRRDDVIGRNCRFLQGPLSEPSAIAQMREAMAANRQVMVPITNYRADGSVFENLVLLFPVGTAGSAAHFIMGSQYDVTAPRRTVSLAEHVEILDERLAASGACRLGRDMVLLADDTVRARALDSRG